MYKLKFINMIDKKEKIGVHLYINIKKKMFKIR